MVFPIGMYAAASWNLVRADDLDFLGWIPRGFLSAALIAWLVSAAGILRRSLGPGSGLSPGHDQT